MPLLNPPRKSSSMLLPLLCMSTTVLLCSSLFHPTSAPSVLHCAAASLFATSGGELSAKSIILTQSLQVQNVDVLERLQYLSAQMEELNAASESAGTADLTAICASAGCHHHTAHS
jgi:hypothetical protein